MDPALTLLQIDRIGREVPVVNDMAVGMEVQPFLPDRRCGKDERPKGRIECLPHASRPDECFAVVIADITKPDCEPTTDRKLLYANMAVRSCFQVIHT